MNERDELYLTHIRESIEKITLYTREGRDAFLASTMQQDAVVRNFEIIGEAAKRLSEPTKAMGDISWRKVCGFRDFLIHQYSGVSLPQVWQVIVDDVPPLYALVCKLLDK